MNSAAEKEMAVWPEGKHFVAAVWAPFIDAVFEGISDAQSKGGEFAELDGALPSLFKRVKPAAVPAKTEPQGIAGRFDAIFRACRSGTGPERNGERANQNRHRTPARAKWIVHERWARECAAFLSELGAHGSLTAGIN